MIVFDGVRLLCSRWGDFVLAHDRAGRFRLAAMHGAHGHALLQAHGLAPDDPASFLLVQDGRGHTGTDTIMQALRASGGRRACLPNSGERLRGLCAMLSIE